MPRVIQVIEASELRGKGVEESPIRSVATYYTPEGKLLGAAYDPDAEADEFARNGWKLPSIAAAAVQLDYWKSRALLAEKRLAETGPLAAKLVDVVRWALGEIGEFVSPPESITDVLAAGRASLLRQKKGRFPTPLYWWRGELRRRAIEAGATLGEREVKDE